MFAGGPSFRGCGCAPDPAAACARWLNLASAAARSLARVAGRELLAVKPEPRVTAEERSVGDRVERAGVDLAAGWMRADGPHAKRGADGSPCIGPGVRAALGEEDAALR